MTESKTFSVLNVGGGSKDIPLPSCYNGWQHLLLDINPKYKPDICLDARQLHTLPPGMYDAIYCAHNLEHYHRHEAAAVIRGFHHVLKPDGFADIRVPDLGAVFRRVVEAGLDIDSELYVSVSGLPILVRDVIYGYHVEIEQSGQEFYTHRTGFTIKSLGRLLGSNGFGFSAAGTGGPFEIVAYAFKQMPTAQQRAMLPIAVPA